LKRDQSIETITFEEALDLFKLPLTLGDYEGEQVYVNVGRFGPYIKWNDMFINVPRRYNHDNLSQADINELVEAKIKKEANRYIQHWPEEKISVENARWGPLIKFGKKIVRLPKKADDTKYTADDLKDLPLEEVKKMIEAAIPNAFGKKKAAKKAPAKTAAKPPAKKKAATKKKK
ncbi:MAG TPA: topoisomerase C-terminal repeat-containing protein, partial [Chitinophagaceae bacterium]